MNRTALLLLSVLLALSALGAQAQLSEFPLPVGYWSFDRCDTVSGLLMAMDDSSATRAPGAGHTDATLGSGASCAAGRYGTAGLFDGVNDRADVPQNGRFNFSASMTVAALVKPATVSGSRTILNKWYGGDAYMLSIQNGSYVFTVRDTTGRYTSVSAAAAANAWAHVAGVMGQDAGGYYAQIYKNGASAQKVYTAGPIQQSTRPLVIGNNPSWNAYQGLIDEVKLYTQALSSTQVARLATAPGALGNRGLHLLSDPYAPNPYGDPGQYALFKSDLSRIQHVTNLNSLKTTIFTFGASEVPGSGDQTLLALQRDKLTQTKAAAGNHVTWVLRVWPTVAGGGAGWVDLTPRPSCTPWDSTYFYEQGRSFARRLAQVFAHVQGTLKLQNVHLEVGNEPNLLAEGFSCGGFSHPAAYNDFLRGFYFGEREVGYAFPLVYAGLSPGPDDGGAGRYSADAWYQDYWTVQHINSYAAKIGAHSYWQGDGGANDRTSLDGGWYYRKVKNLLSAAGVTPRGIFVTEFNGQRLTFSGGSGAQAQSFCDWWREAGQAASQGYWTEQTLLWVSSHVNRGAPGDQEIVDQYILLDSQVATVRTCQ